MLSEHGIKGPVQIAVVERQGFTDALFEGKPAVLPGIQLRGVGRQEFLRTPGLGNELASLGGLRETGVVIDPELAWLEDGHQTVLDIRLKERRVAGSLEHEGGDQVMGVERRPQTHPLGALARFLPPARFALQTPAVGSSFIIIQARLIQLPQLFGGYPRHLGPQLFPQRFVSLGVAKGLFLCGSPSLRRCRQRVLRFPPPQASASSSTVASPWSCTKALHCSGAVILCEWPRW